MQLSTALFSFLALTPTVLSLAPQYARQTSLDLPLSLCALNLESANDHIIDAVCTGPFKGAEIDIVNSKLSLDKCLTNSFGKLEFQSFGDFSATCYECTFDGNTLDFSCNCDDGVESSSGFATDINLARTTPGSSGVFLQDDGNIACQVPDV